MTNFIQHNEKTESGIDKIARTSDVAWTNKQWVYNLIWPYMETANEKSGWKFDIKAAESMQITRYKKREFYNFHKDGKSDSISVYDQPNNKFLHGHVRKLSITVLLNDNYTGGEFQFAYYKNGNCEITTPNFTKTGSIIVFPSFIEHRVQPVTKGVRYSLVAWFVGPPFK